MPVLGQGAVLKRGTFVIERLLGRGGFGEVYLAAQPRVGRQVAVKVLRPGLGEDPDVLRRFEREARAAGSFLHPHIVPVLDFDFDEAEAVWFLAMQYVPGGRTLRDRLVDPLSVDEASQIVSALASALDTAHARGVLHRDVKPSNVLLDEADRPLLSDFGIAHLDSISAVTQPGVRAGTALYMAPERWKGEPADAAGDQYSLAVMAYQMLAGRPPFVGDQHSLMMQHLSVEPPRLVRVRPEITEAMDLAVLRALRKERGDRFDTCGQLADELARAVEARRLSALAMEYENAMALVWSGDLRGALARLEAVQRQRVGFRDTDLLVDRLRRELAEADPDDNQAPASPPSPVAFESFSSQERPAPDVPISKSAGAPVDASNPPGADAGRAASPGHRREAGDTVTSFPTRDLQLPTDDGRGVWDPYVAPSVPVPSRQDAGAPAGTAPGPGRTGRAGASTLDDKRARPPLLLVRIVGAAVVAVAAAGVLLSRGLDGGGVQEPVSDDRPAQALPARTAVSAAPDDTVHVEADADWDRALAQLDGLWGEDWLAAIDLIDRFRLAHPGYAAADAKLYAALTEYGKELADLAQDDEAESQLRRAEALLPGQGDAESALQSLPREAQGRAPATSLQPPQARPAVPTATIRAPTFDEPAGDAPPPTATLRPPPSDLFPSDDAIPTPTLRPPPI
ncbi:MAG TPA: protein kinase [Chloroflexota bacterium]|nr:protein kinase [Chloroflexota bacterium]